MSRLEHSELALGQFENLTNLVLDPYKYDLVHCIGTHTSQKPPETVKDDDRSYLQLVVALAVKISC